MLSAYFDDSGTDQRNRAAVVGGYVGSDFQWERFVARWTKTLNDAHVEVLHRSDLESFQGEFAEAKGWNPPRRTELVRKLHSIIKTSTYSAVGSSVIKDDFNTVMPVWVKHLFGGAYGWCAFWCVVAMRGWCVERHITDTIAWHFESGTRGASEIKEMFQALRHAELRDSYRINSVCFSGKELKPLQAADVVAYEIFKHVENQILDGGQRHPRRLSALDLFRRQDERYVTFWNKDRLIHWLAKCDREHPFGDIPADQLDQALRRK
jgi:hypothetical protein